MAHTNEHDSIAERARRVSSLSGFKKFLLRGNLVDLAVAVVIGTAFAGLVKALSADFITPLIAAVGGQHDFSALAFTVHNSTFKYGDFVNNLVSFVIMAAVVYYFVVLPVGKMLERFKPTPDAPVSTQECRHCLSKIPVKATVCAFCTRELATGEPTAAT